MRRWQSSTTHNPTKHSPQPHHLLFSLAPHPIPTPPKTTTPTQNSHPTPNVTGSSSFIVPRDRHYPVTTPPIPRHVKMRETEIIETHKNLEMAATIEDPDTGRPDPTPGSDSLLRNPRYCFCFPCFGGGRRHTNTGLGWWERMREAESDNPWWAKGFTAIRKVREWSEIVAGPKWKTFIRRFNRTRSGGGGSGGGRHGKYQYDPLSYALNFDEGQNGNFDEEDEYGRFRDFSTRYASVSSPVKKPAAAAAEFGNGKGKDLPVFTSGD